MESLSEITINNSGGRGGRREPGRTGAGEGGKRENEGQAAGSIWGREAGERGAGSGIYMGAGSGSRNKEGDSLFFFTGYYSVKNTYLANF